MQVYIKAASKKVLNEKLALKEHIEATEYNMLHMNDHILNDLPTGTVIKIYDKIVGGSPYAKSYGVWNKEKNKIA